jgi:8-oxo-dGTP pyrophosphatase MutT (NUDIX family)
MEIEKVKSRQPIPENAKRVFKGKIFDVYQWEQKMYDGSIEIFEKLKRPDTVVVFPVLPDGRIILTEQEQPNRGLFLGTAGGRVENGEDIIEAAKRELLEETGYKADEYILWKAEQIIDKIDWNIYTFVAKGAKKIAEQELDSGEKIKLKLVNFEEFIEVALNENFEEKQIIPNLFEAKLYPEKMQELKKLFTPK